MAETNFFQLFKATWAQNGTTDRISAAQYSTGWAYIGSLPPTVEQFNAVQQFTDQKLTWVYRHLEAVATLTGRELTAAGSDAISYAFENLNASRLTAGTVPVERLPERAPSMTVGAAAKWETPRNISISGGATARAKLFDGSADVTLEVTGLSMSAATGVLPPTHGGTGLDEIPAGNYLVGNGKGAMMSKTPDQVSEDLFISMRAIEAIGQYGLATDNGVDVSNRLTDLDDLDIKSGFYVARGVPSSRNWLGSGFLLHRLYDSNGFQMGCALGSGILQFRERDRGVWKQPVKLANLDSPAFTGTPTAPTPALTDNSTRLATTAHVAGSVRAALDAYAATRGRSSAQFGATGWWRCGDTGLIRQWGISQVPGDSEAWVTFPIAFPNICLGGSATQGGKFSVLRDAGAGLNNLNSTAAILRNGVGEASPMYWEVWGY
ncbi:hypothetical protein JE034_09765 [Achromobacter xylosoxidans]|uniref:gp53-like domain-containing protein n=1 Tax=Alcaligenes xylosoxydans xylosoxydans TaxID=85698 RepID=UPI0019058D47|nr:hypothetical protein [Achromobacter xylosoxidans]MBK1979144.1 hypothetical protein [Achromobacter xylosoxidans]